jgi:FkbM family methyltransferase
VRRLRTLVYRLAPGRLRRRLPVPSRVEAALPGGLTLRYHAGGDPIARILYWEDLRAHPEAASLGLFARLARDAEAIFDVGANTGVYALVAGLANPGARVFAFEPVPRIHARLGQNVTLNGLRNVACVASAVGDAVRSVALHVPRAPFPSDASMRSGFRENTEEIVVPLTTLDHFKRANGIPRVDLVKIDTETTEDRVLAGAREILSRDRPAILCEVLKGFVESSLQRILEEHDYRVFHITDRGLESQAGIGADPSYRDRNFLFLHASQVARAAPGGLA